MTSQTRQILDAFEVMPASVDSDPVHVMHSNIFLADMADFTEMNAAYAEKTGERCPACTASCHDWIAQTGRIADNESYYGQQSIGSN